MAGAVIARENLENTVAGDFLRTAGGQAPCTCAARRQMGQDPDISGETRDALAPPCPHRT